VERALRKSGPEEANEVSPALQEWDRWEKRFKFIKGPPNSPRVC
jgi:hypothetical protein